MRLLYLDTMDLGNLCDGLYGPSAPSELSAILRDTDGALAFSQYHLIELFGASEATLRTRLECLFAAKIPLMTFGDDPRDLELQWMYHRLMGTAAPPSVGLLPILHEEIEGLATLARTLYPQIQEVNQLSAKAEFFSNVTDPRTRQIAIRRMIAPVQNDLPTRLAALAQFEKVDLGQHIAAPLKSRYQAIHTTTVEEDLAAVRPMARRRILDRRALARVRRLLRDHAIDIDREDSKLSWDEAVERIMITKRARALLHWTPPSEIFPNLTVNRIPHLLDSRRRLDPQRVTEPGDFVDPLHAIYLPMVRVMTCDKRTHTMLESAKIPALADWVKARLRRGGNRKRFDEAVMLFRRV